MTENIQMWYDGACDNVEQKGLIGLGVLIKMAGAPLFKASKSYKNKGWSSNVVEYKALILGLHWLLDNGFKNNAISVYGDNMMSVRQMARVWRVKKGLYVPFWLQARELAAKFDNITFEWITRERNTEADALSRAVMSKRRTHGTLQRV